MIRATVDGIGTLEFPEGTSRDVINATVKRVVMQRGIESRKKSDPAEYDPASAEYQERYGPTGSFGENLAAGVGKAFRDTGAGLKQLFADIGAAAAPNVYEPIAADIKKQATERATEDAPLMRTGGGLTGYVGGQLAQFAAPMGAVPRAASFAGRLGQGVGTGAALANTQPVTEDQSRLGNTAIGAAGGALGEVAAAGIGRAVSRARSVTPEVEALARRAQELEIPLRAEQVSQSRPLAGVSAALDMVPFSGRDAARATQRTGFNRAIARTFGENSDNLATAVRDASRTLGDKYDDVLKTYAINADNALLDGADDVLRTARSELTDQQFGVIQRQVDELLGKVRPDGTIDAQAGYNLKKVLDRLGRGQDSSIAYHANRLRDELIQALDRSLPEKVARDFAKTRKQYGNLIAVRRLVKAGAEGNVSPAVLGNVKGLRGELKDVADIGAQFLKEPFGNSGTANRLFGAGVLGGLGTGALFEPTAALTAALGGATLGRGANALLGARPLVNYQLQGIPRLQPILPHAERLLPLLGAGGAIASQ